jgi:D-alanyl-D-alanine carboxypeptidase (penicillin-binding protein 5/6)
MVIKQTKLSFFLRFFTFISLFLPIFVAASPALIPSAPQVSASSYILMDATSGDILIAEDSHKRLPPASLTKMMTAYIVEHEVAEGRINLYDQVPISVKAWKTGGSKMFIKEGTKVVLEDLLKGVVIQSGNDASIALAEYVAGSESAFADIMNQQAKLLGMKDTNFENSTGLPSENHYTTAFDLALLAQAIIMNYPEQYLMYAEKYFTYNSIRQPNRNRLLWRDKSVDGLKTGHTEEAGYCLVSSAERDGMRLISVVMGTNSENARAQESQKLLNYGFRYFETHNLYNAGASLIESTVWLGLASKVQLGLAKEVIITIPRGQKDALKAELLVDPIVKAPLTVGQKLGQLEVTLKGEIIVSEPLVALEPVPEAGFFKRLWDSIKLFFIGLFS